MLIVVIKTIFALLNASQEIYDTFETSKEAPKYPIRHPVIEYVLDTPFTVIVDLWI